MPTCSSSGTALRRTASRRRKPRRARSRDLAREVGRRRPPGGVVGAPPALVLVPPRSSRTRSLRVLPGQRDHQQRRSDGGRTPVARHLRRCQSMFQSVLISAMGVWFLAIGAGLVLIRDAELRVGRSSTDAPDRPRVRVGQLRRSAGGVPRDLGPASGTVRRFQSRPGGGADTPHIGPFVLTNYLYPALLLGLPQIVFFAGVPLFLGAWTRRAIVVYAFPSRWWSPCWDSWSPGLQAGSTRRSTGR